MSYAEHFAQYLGQPFADFITRRGVGSDADCQHRLERLLVAYFD